MINLNKTATQAVLQFSVSFMCLEAYAKNPLLFDLRIFFGGGGGGGGLTLKLMLFGLSGKAYFIWRRGVKNALPVTSELYG